MSRKKVNKKNKKSSQRYVSTISKISDLLRPIKKQKRTTPDVRLDRRRFVPPLDNYLLQDNGNQVRYSEAKKTKTGKYSSGQIRFVSPKKVRVCQQRSERRKALFKLGKAGKGVKGPKFRKLTPNSKIRC